MISSCPRKLITSESCATVAMANFAERGHLPRAGGYLDQQQREIALIQTVWAFTNEALADRDNDNGSEER